MLQLYSNEKLASTTTISIAAASAVQTVLLASRLHLIRLGLSEHTLRLPRAASLELAKKAA